MKLFLYFMGCADKIFISFFRMVSFFDHFSDDKLENRIKQAHVKFLPVLYIIH
jgi:hypothetical protein